MSSVLIITAYGFFFLLLFSLSLFIFIILRRVVSRHQEEHHRRVYRLIEKEVLDVISSIEPERPLQVAYKYRSHLAVLTEVLLDYGNLLLGDAKKQLSIIFRQDLKDRCLRNLSSRRTIKRLKSARLFIVFFEPTESEYLFKLLNDKPIVKLAAITALSHLPSQETLHLVFKAFEHDEGTAVISYFNIMFGLGDRIEMQVKFYLKKPLPRDKLLLLIELVGAIPLRTLYEDIVVFADHSDKEVRIRVARALGKLLIPDSVNTLVTLAADQAWEVKAQALKSLGRLKNPDTLDILTQSLFSPHWYVRYNAGYGLAVMGERGFRRLKEVATQDKDQYARDMSAMVLSDFIYLEEAA
jgi:hypothetical protein